MYLNTIVGIGKGPYKLYNKIISFVKRSIIHKTRSIYYKQINYIITVKTVASKGGGGRRKRDSLT